jgi:hypothetical protein
MTSEEIDGILMVYDSCPNTGAGSDGCLWGYDFLLIVTRVKLVPYVVFEVKLPQVVGFASINIATKDIHGVIVRIAA